MSNAMTRLNEMHWLDLRRRSMHDIPLEQRPPKLLFMVNAIYAEKKRNSVHLFGTTRDGDSVHCEVKHFHHFIWARTPAHITHANQLETLREQWNAQLTSFDDEPIAALEMHDKRDLMYYSPEPERMLRVVLSTPNQLYPVRELLSRHVTMFEEREVSYELRFTTEHNVVGFGWCVADAYRPASDSSCTWDVSVDVRRFSAFTPDDDKAAYGHIAPLRILDFDIECCADKGFPQPDYHPVIQIAVQVHEMGSGVKRCLLDAVLYTKPTSAFDESTVMCEYESEEALLRGFQRLVVAVDYDVSRNYNGRNFDWSYLMRRAVALGVTDFPHLGRLRGVPATLASSNFQSKARGKRSFDDVFVPGRTDFDILHVVRCEEKLRSYKLDDVAFELLGDAKDDVHHSMISVLYNGTPDDRSRLAKYCRKDALLCRLIDEKMMYLLRYIELGRVCRVTLEKLITQGQQIKVLAQLLHLTREYGFVCPTKRYASKPMISGQKYDGALVLEPKKGFHLEPIVCMDFSALYPSLAIAYNLCYSTLVKPEDVARYAPEDVRKTPAGYYFVKKHIREGVFCTLLKRLLDARKVAKGDKKTALVAAKKLIDEGRLDEGRGKEEEANVQDARQLAIKLSANSGYGFTGTSLEAGGKVPCREVAESITAYGREALGSIQTYTLEKYPGSEIAYGDSVTGDTPVIVRRNGRMDLVTCTVLMMDMMWERRDDGSGKDTAVLAEDAPLEIWSDGRFVRVREFIRHRCMKPLVRIVTGRGMVDCTTDHSLVRANGEEVAPDDVRLGDALMHCTLPTTVDCGVAGSVPQFSMRSRGSAYACGVFMASGTLQMATMNVCFAAPANTSEETLEHVQKKLETVIGLPLSLLDGTTLTINETVTCAEDRRAFVMGMAADMFTMGTCGVDMKSSTMASSVQAPIITSMSVPRDILWGGRELARAFLVGFEAWMSTSLSFVYAKGVVPSKLAAAGVVVLYWRLGASMTAVPSVSLVDGVYQDVLVIVTVDDTGDEHDDGTCVRSLSGLPGAHEGEYVFDFATANHHFGVGPGQLVVHNTDSVMVKPGAVNGVTTVREAMDWMHRVSGEINRDLWDQLPPMKLAPEKVMYPSLFLAKKRYAAGYYETNTDVPDKVYYRGLEVARRDSCLFAIGCFKECCEKIFIERDIDGAVQCAKNAIQRLFLGQVPLEQLTLTSSLSQAPEEYKTPQAHTVLAQRMAQREPASAPAVGDRMGFVMVGGGASIRDMAEDPEYARAHDLQPNVDYYLNNQLKKPLERLFVPIIGVERTGELFHGDHTRRRVSRLPTGPAPAGSLLSFVQLARTCTRCGESFNPKKHRHVSLCRQCCEADEAEETEKVE